jgi:hypothetical protein
MSFLQSYNVVKTGELKKGKIDKSTLRFTLKTGKNNIAVQDVRELLNGLEDLAKTRNEKVKYMVRIMNIKGIYTVKSFDGALNLQEYLDYYGNVVKDTRKFEKIGWIEVTKLTYKK